ncbi:MAG TPA: nuclear transport factor 2 family protein [Allosphingosinicella sp.]|jgi:hypothetical protein
MTDDDIYVPLRRQALRAMVALPLGLAAGAAAAQAPARRAPAGNLATRLDILESKDRITEVLYAYARSNDRLDEALLRSCFWPESTHKHGGFSGKSSDFAGFAIKIIGGLRYAAHHISNVSVEVRGNRAFSECYYFAHHRRAAKEGGGEEDAFFEGRYLDRHERRGGEWRIIQRRGLSDFSTVVPAKTLHASWPEGQHSLRYPDDDYYAMRRAFEAGR